MRILLTRSAEESERFAEILRARGHESILSPAIEIHLEDGAPLSLQGVQAILATSANGVRALARRTGRRDLPLFVVGPQTAEAAGRAGFTTVRHARGNSDILARKIPEWASPNGGALLYATGDAPAGVLPDALSSHGFRVEVLRLYMANERLSLTAPAAAALASDAVDAVMLFSPRTACVFVRHVLQAGLRENCGKVAALCISPGVAGVLAPISFADVRVAAQPNREGMLDLLG
jgi:uroporphyrinogen-III synthase